jgi:hypothetical protein
MKLNIYIDNNELDPIDDREADFANYVRFIADLISSGYTSGEGWNLEEN